MKKIGLLTFIVVIMLLYPTATNASIYISKNLYLIISYSHTDWQQGKKTQANQVYACSMHPEMIMDKAGNCPKFGMNLVLKQPAKKDVPKKK